MVSVGANIFGHKRYENMSRYVCLSVCFTKISTMSKCPMEFNIISDERDSRVPNVHVQI